MQEQLTQLRKGMFSIQNSSSFEEAALEVFRFQYENNPIYGKYVDYLGVLPSNVKKLSEVPFLPIEFFKNHRVIVENLKEEVVFLSSGTTGTNQSKHYVANKNIYHQSFLQAFEYFYGSVGDYCFLALLPGYLEREGSSLIYMVEHMMQLSKHPDNGFYLNEYGQLANKIDVLKKTRKKYLIFGVTYALLDFAKLHPMALTNGIIMETGGMKGKRKEMTKEEVHERLKSCFQLQNIHSEYGMTELLSQAYSKGNGLFSAPPWMKITIRDTYDPFSYQPIGKSGGINVIDLANLYSCSFIETKDLGKMHPNGQFEVLGRFDNSDIRGCNLLVD